MIMMGKSIRQIKVKCVYVTRIVVQSRGVHGSVVLEVGVLEVLDGEDRIK